MKSFFLHKFEWINLLCYRSLEQKKKSYLQRKNISAQSVFLYIYNLFTVLQKPLILKGNLFWINEWNIHITPLFPILIALVNSQPYLQRISEQAHGYSLKKKKSHLHIDWGKHGGYTFFFFFFKKINDTRKEEVKELLS